MDDTTKIRKYLTEMHDEFEKEEFKTGVEDLYRSLTRSYRKCENLMSLAGCDEYMEYMEEIRHLIGGQGMGGMVQDENILGKLRDILGDHDEPNKDDPEKPYIK